MSSLYIYIYIIYVHGHHSSLLMKRKKRRVSVKMNRMVNFSTSLSQSASSHLSTPSYDVIRKSCLSMTSDYTFEAKTLSE